MKSVVVVDVHNSLRQMLTKLLPDEGPYDVVGEARTGYEALKVCRKHLPDLVILDLLLPELSGLEVLRTLREEAIATRFVVFTGATCREIIRATLQARPHGFVHRTDDWSDLRDALRTVSAGGSYLSPFATRVLDRSHADPRTNQPLAPRERMVLQMIAEGMSNKEMAGRLSLSAKTVEHHRAQVMEKLGLHSVAALTRYAVRQGLVSIEG